MLTKVKTGTWLPAYVPNNSGVLAALLLLAAMAQSATGEGRRELANSILRRLRRVLFEWPQYPPFLCQLFQPKRSDNGSQYRLYLHRRDHRESQ
jgi:hypothetical protein